MYIPISLYGKRFEALLDTGATTSLVSTKFIRRLQERGINTQFDAKQRRAAAINKTLLTIDGSAILTVNFINGLSMDWKFAASDDISHLLVLGMDFINFTKPTLEFGSDNMYFSKDMQDLPQLPLREVPKSKKSKKRQHEQISSVTDNVSDISDRIRVKVSTSEPIVVPKNCEMIVQIPVKANGHTAAVFPVKSFSHFYGLGLANELVNIKRGMVPIRFTNSTERDITIPSGTRIAVLEPYEIVSALQEPKQRPIDEEWLEQKFKISERSDLTSDQLHNLKLLLWRNRDCFKDTVGNTNLAEHPIKLAVDKVVRSHPYRIPESQKEFVRTELQRLEELGIIRPSKSPFSSPIVLVKKKDGTLRFCVDYRKLNAITIKDVYPLPRIDDLLSHLAFNGWFSTFDANNGFWQIPMRKKDKQKTAFTTPYGLFEFNQMPFGMCNAPSTFQRLMDMVLSGLSWRICLVYMDDIIVYSRTFEEHVENVNAVLGAIRAANITLKASKCKLFKRQLSFLGHIVSADGIATDPSKIKAIRNMPVPKNVTDLRSFLGLAGYYRRFIKNFAIIAEPLNMLTRKEVKWKWSTDQDKAFNTLKEKLTESPVLGYPDFNSTFVLYTDASNHGIGAVLQQNIDGADRVIGYYSRTLNKAERNYSTTEKECLAVVEAVRYYRYYLLGRKFQIVVDHNSLKWLQSVSDKTQRLCRWSIDLQEFDFDIVYRPGKQHQNADALSRLTAEQVNMVTDLKEFREAQWQDPMFMAYFDYLLHDKLPDERTLADVVRSNCKDLKVIDDVLFRLWTSPFDKEVYHQALVPLTMRADILNENHDSAMAGHLGFLKTYTRLRERYYWPKMAQDISEWIASCEHCVRRKSSKIQGKLQPLDSIAPFETIGIDIMGPFEPTKNGNRFIVVIIDHFTKWVEAFAIESQTTLTIATKLVEEVICRHGAPRRILTDQGANLDASKLAQDIYHILQSKKVRTTPYHPQTDGLTENFNKTLAAMLQAFVNKHRDDWDEYLNYVLFAYRTAIHHSTHYTPFFLLYGRQARLPSDLDQIEDKYGDYRNLDSYAIDILQKFNAHHKRAHTNSTKAKIKQKENHDKSRSDIKVYVGDRVWITDDTIAGKLAYKNNGPYLVSKIRGNTVRVSDLDGNNESKPISVSKIKLQPTNTLRGVAPSTGVTQELADKNSPPITPLKQRHSIDSQLVEILTDSMVKISDDPTKLAAAKKIFNQLLGRGSQLVKSYKNNDYYVKQIKQSKTPAELRTLIKDIINGAGAPSSENKEGRM